MFAEHCSMIGERRYLFVMRLSQIVRSPLTFGALNNMKLKSPYLFLVHQFLIVGILLMSVMLSSMIASYLYLFATRLSLIVETRYSFAKRCSMIGANQYLFAMH